MKKLLPILILSLLYSCSATKQSAKFTHKALAKDSATAIDIFRKVAPCVKTATKTLPPVIKTRTKIVIDTLIKTDTVKGQCKDGEVIKIPCTQKTVTKTNYDTTDIITHTVETVKDGSDDITIRDLQDKLTKQIYKKEWWFYAAVISFILFLLSLIVNIIQSKNKSRNEVSNIQA